MTRGISHWWPFIAGAPAHVLGEGTHVLHDKFGLFENLGVDPLQHELFFFGQICIDGDQISIIDIAIAKFVHI